MPTELFSFSDLLGRVVPGFSGHKRWKAIRHLDRSADAPDFVELFHTGRAAIEFYQSYQGKDIFRDCEGFFSFLGLPGGRAQFMAAYRVNGPGKLVLLPDAADPVVPAAFRPMWSRWKAVEAGVPKNYWYELEPDHRFQALEMRPVIDWGDGERAWHQWSLDKPVLELRQSDAIGACPDYREIDVPLATLKFLLDNEAANPSWPTRLGAVGGIYLLTDHANNKLYVGQAGADRGGFWGRWASYARQQSGNAGIDPAFAAETLRMDTTTMSILEVVPLGAATKALLDRLEGRWKTRLRTRHSMHGYNLN